MCQNDTSMATTAAMASQPHFDPLAQNITLWLEDGSPLNVTVGEVDHYYLYSVQINIVYAAQLGACLMLLIVLAAITKPEKRRAPVFILNSISLAVNVIRLILVCTYFTGPFSEAYAVLTDDFSYVPFSAYATSVAAVVLSMLLVILVEASLLIQAQVVCVALPKLYQYAIFGLSLAIGSLALAVRLVLTVQNIRLIMSTTGETSLIWISKFADATLATSIIWFCVVFVAKLGYALHRRRKLGLRRFGPMEILFIMGCQTLLVPALFSILEFAITIPAMDSNALTLVTIFLPLSAIWACNSLREHPAAAINGAGARQGFSSNGSSTKVASSGGEHTFRSVFRSKRGHSSTFSSSSISRNSPADTTSIAKAENDLEKGTYKD